jgi:hypothetical protein
MYRSPYVVGTRIQCMVHHFPGTVTGRHMSQVREQCRVHHLQGKVYRSPSRECSRVRRLRGNGVQATISHRRRNTG